MANSLSKKRLRMEQAVRLEVLNLGLTDAQIAEHIGLQPTTYAALKNDPDYVRLRTQLVTGVLGDIDNDIKLERERLHEVGVPTALRVLLDSALQRSDPKLAVSAACEILDRDGTFAKVSRTTSTVTETININPKDDAIADELVAALAKARKK